MWHLHIYGICIYVICINGMCIYVICIYMASAYMASAYIWHLHKWHVHIYGIKHLWHQVYVICTYIWHLHKWHVHIWHQAFMASSIMASAYNWHEQKKDLGPKRALAQKGLWPKSIVPKRCSLEYRRNYLSK